MISAYLYSTTRTKAALIINVLRSLTVNIVVILLLPRIFGSDAIWYTFGVYEGIVMMAAIILKYQSDRNGAIGTALE